MTEKLVFLVTFISATDPVTLAGICSYLPLLPIQYFFHP